MVAATTWKVSIFGVFLVCIFRIRTEYRPEKLRIRTLFTLWAVPKMGGFWINLEPVLDVLHLNYWLCSIVAMKIHLQISWSLAKSVQITHFQCPLWGKASCWQMLVENQQWIHCKYVYGNCFDIFIVDLYRHLHSAEGYLDVSYFCRKTPS